MHSPDSELGMCAIAHHPADYDPRESELFNRLQTEIDKLASMHASGSTDWSSVAELASRYLREEAKDLTVAAWLAAAWLHTASGLGALAAAQVLKDLVQSHWDTLLPARPRARRNQLTWLEGIVERFMGSEQDLPPLSESDYAALVQSWRDLDIAWRHVDEEAPSFSSFALRFSQWPIAETETTAQAESISLAAPADEPTPAASTSPSAPAEPTPLAPPVVAPKPAPQTETPINVNLGTEWDSAPALERALDQAMDAMGTALEAGVRDFPAHTLWYRLNRTRVWAGLDNAPNAQQGETRIPGPNDHLRSRLTQLIAGTDYAATLAFAESQLMTGRFWLDLNFASFTALSHLPDGQSAATAIAQETAALIARIPALTTLKFLDGTPFANEQTQAWLSQHTTAISQPTATHTSQTMTASRPAQRSMAPAGGLLALSAAIAAATAQTESAQTLLNAALSRLHDSALQVASHALTEHQSS